MTETLPCHRNGSLECALRAVLGILHSRTRSIVRGRGGQKNEECNCGSTHTKGKDCSELYTGTHGS
jgi:hypothetical protein